MRLQGLSFIHGRYGQVWKEDYFVCLRKAMGYHLSDSVFVQIWCDTAIAYTWEQLICYLQCWNPALNDTYTR